MLLIDVFSIMIVSHIFMRVKTNDITICPEM